MRFDNPENLIAMTPEWKGERFPDGRPKVPDSVLERIRKVAIEEAKSPLFPISNPRYKAQFTGGLKSTNPDPNYVLVGRASTAVMLPSRPDVHMAMLREGRRQGRVGMFNQWTIEGLQENDVLVVDMFDKVQDGTFIGGNLATAIKNKTKKGGLIVWGGLRDLQQIEEIEDFQVYYRGIHPDPLADVMLGGINIPCRIGNAVCIPGDVVLANRTGVLFIPPQYAEAAAISGEKTQIKDVFGFLRLEQGVYSGAQIDSAWTKEILDDFLDWFKTAPEAVPYQHLTWEDELYMSEHPGEFVWNGFSSLDKAED